MHAFEGLWILNRSALGLLHIGILGRDTSSLPGCTFDCGLKHSEHFTAAFVWLWEVCEIDIWHEGKFYLAQMECCQAEKSPGRICRTTSMFGNALSGDIGRLPLKGSQKAIDSVEREILQEEQRQPATADVS